MRAGPEFPGFEALDIYYAPPTDGGGGGRRRHLGQSILPREASLFDDDTVGEEEVLAPEGDIADIEELPVPDSDIVSEAVEKFMSDLYHGTDRYANHNDRVLKMLPQYNRVAPEVAGMAVALHDFVDHPILHPKKTAAKLGLKAEDIKASALGTFNEILSRVDDQDGLIKAYLFAIDASKWESAAQMWRESAAGRINEVVTAGKMDEEDGEIVLAAINKDKGILGAIGKDELAEVLKRASEHLIDLELGAISQGTLNHNIEGLSIVKAPETIDIIENPPPNNPASTFRDCIEAINFFAPALVVLGYPKLAMDLRGAALKWLFDDPNGDAERQNGASQRHFDALQEIVAELREQDFGGLEVDTEARVKHEGSIRAKLASDNYSEVHAVPDGIGFAFIVPDEMGDEEIMQFAESYMEKLTDGEQKIIAKHPIDTEPAFEKKERKNGYRAVHMAFYYYPEDDPVPFEIQVLTQTQHKMKTFGRWSDLFYKAGTEYTPEDQRHMDHLAKRGHAEREMAPASTIQSIAEMIAVSPEVPSIFNKLFRAVDSADGRRLLVPPTLEKLAREIPGLFDRVPGESGDLTVLPADKVSEAQFEEALNMFGLDITKDKNIQKALASVRDPETDNKRRDGITSILEGHLLPTALGAVMLAIQSGKIWDSEKLSPTEYLSNIVTIVLLHDHIEAALEKLTNRDEILQKRQEMLYEVKRTYGLDIMEGVDAMTLPMEVEDQDERRDQYAQNIRANGYARLIKPIDRWQNHLTDLIKLVAAKKVRKSSELYKSTMKYFRKTDRHQSADFTAPDLPDVYRRVHRVIWEFAKSFGYQPETK
jgi:hypothetical protein